MKKFKMDILSRLEKMAVSDKLISFRQAAKDCGFAHVKTIEVREILHAFLKKHPEYMAIQLMQHSGDSLFTSLHLVDRSVVFESEEFFDDED